MSRNLELKARLRSVERAVNVARFLRATDRGVIHQKDTFLMMGERRLKLRQEDRSRPELIYYDRPNGGTTRGRWSTFVRVPVSSPLAVLRAFASPVDRPIVVAKQRHLFVYQNARIHIDRVRILGPFIEFEVKLERGEEQAKRKLEFLRTAFGIRREDIVGTAYADLLRDRLQA